jgi:hypothetical protein
LAPSPEPALVMKKLIAFSCELIVVSVAAAAIKAAEASRVVFFIDFLLDL